MPLVGPVGDDNNLADVVSYRREAADYPATTRLYQKLDLFGSECSRVGEHVDFLPFKNRSIASSHNRASERKIIDSLAIGVIHEERVADRIRKCSVRLNPFVQIIRGKDMEPSIDCYEELYGAPYTMRDEILHMRIVRPVDSDAS